MKFKVPETPREHYLNTVRDLYIKIDTQARDVGFDIFKSRKLAQHPKLTKRENEEYGLHDTPKAFMESYYKDDLPHLKELIKRLFSVKGFHNPKLRKQTYQWLKSKDYTSLFNRYTFLYSHMDAPMEHWRWRNAHENPGKPAPQEKMLMSMDIKTGQMAAKYHLQVKHYHYRGKRCTALINKKTGKALQLSELPKPMKKQIKTNINLANYLDKRK